MYTSGINSDRIHLWFLVIVLSIAFFSCNVNGQQESLSSSRSIDELKTRISQTTNNKPWTYWWWLGSAVDKKSIDYSLKKFQEAGLGGMHVIPIYGVKGEEDNFLDYLSPEWVDMLAYTKEQADKLGLGLDMTLGTGWCFGGKGIDENTGTMYGNIQRITLPGGTLDIDLSQDTKYKYNKIQSVLAVESDGSRTDISENASDDQKLSWQTASDSVTLYILRMQGPVFKVKRPAPGGEGYMLDPFSPKALNAYTAGFDSIFNGNLNTYVRSIYHDSYEYQADWTHDLFDVFKEKRGYDLRTYLPELLGENDELSLRVIADYRQTMSELHEDFTVQTRDWAVTNDLLFRNQGHGSPSNWLDIYALADIPETETFGATVYKIPGLTRKEEFINNDQPNRFVLKFASSAAHVMGKPLISSETNTWLREHFRVALSHSKPELDQLFLSGINHIFYHGIAYSSIDAEWPGWQFYASTSFAPTNSIFHHFSAQNKYVARVQQAIRSGQPDNDILLYYPIQDVWHSPRSLSELVKKRIKRGDDLMRPLKTLYKLTAHNYDDWLLPFPLYKAATTLDSMGYAFDYISDKQLGSTIIDGGHLITEGNSYKTLIIPRTEIMPLKTMKAIKKLAEGGGKVIFIDQLPQSVPGLFEQKEREQNLEIVKTEILADGKVTLSRIENKTNLIEQLNNAGNKKESFTSYGIPYIRRRTDEGYLYFISNIYSGKDVNDKIQLGAEAKQVVITDPLTGKSGEGRIFNDKAMLLQLEQGKSLVIETFNKKEAAMSQWNYIDKEQDPISIEGNWQVEFIKGGPELPSSYTTDQLTSWAENGDPEAARFAGTARYSIEFELIDVNADDFILEFEKVKESALIRVNGVEVTTLFAHPFKTSIGTFLKSGSNTLEIEVANLAANRIKDLDTRDIVWRKFYNINFVNIDYKPFDASVWELAESGLIGKVQLVPINFLE